MLNIKTVFFDLDNTLLNHSEAEQIALQEIKNKYFPAVDASKFEITWITETKKNWALFEEKKLTFDQQRAQRIIDVWANYDKKINKEEADNIFTEYLELYEKNWILFEEIFAVIENLKKNKIKIGILTNGDRNQQIRKITSIELLDFIEPDLLITSGGLDFSKPDEKIFKLAQEKAKNIAEEILMVGDNEKQDIITPKQLGWHTYLINHANKESVNELSKLLFS